MKTCHLLWTVVTVVTATINDAAADKSDAADRSTAARSHGRSTGSAPTQKNIILFMTDDQDVTYNSIDPSIMPRLNKLFREEGMEFLNYYVPTGLCCPSRATILRGQYCHNTKIFDLGDLNNSTYKSGGWSKFLDTGLEKETMATLLQSAGYDTAMIGKYLNGYDLFDEKAKLHKPPGWNHWMGKLNQANYYGPAFAADGESVLETNKTVYVTDFMRDWALEFLTDRRDPSKPFFLMLTPIAPHAPAKPAKRHKHMFPDAKFPRYDSFNPSDDIQRQRPAWIKNMPPLTNEQIDDMDHFYRNRLRSLQAVDESLESIVEMLDKLGLTDDTFFIYTSDNGVHFGDHRLPAGKRQAFETDVLVPFLVRGPGVPKGTQSSQVVQSVDLLPTFLDIATSSQQDSNNIMSKSVSVKADGTLIQPSYPVDGKSIMSLLVSDMSEVSTFNDFRWAGLLEMYSGSSNMNGDQYKHIQGYHHPRMFPNTYQAVRVIDGPSDWASGANLLYVEWCTGEQELYNMTVDPHQVNNLAFSDAVVPTGNESATVLDLNKRLPLLHKLSGLLRTLGDCKGSACYELGDKHLRSSMNVNDIFSSSRRTLTLETMGALIRKRMPCHNPPGMTADPGINTNLRRKPFAYDLPVPEPFTHGFPFSDGDDIGEDLSQLWSEYEHYFY